MTEHPSQDPAAPHDDDAAEQASQAIFARALRNPPPLERSLLPSIQARIRRETHGRYFNTGRQRFRDPTVLLLGAAMLLLALGAALVALFDSLFP